MSVRMNRSERKKNDIIINALELFSEHDYEKVSMDNLASKASVSKVTIYKYFGSKEELFSNALKFAHEDDLSRFSDILESDLDFESRLEQLLFRIPCRYKNLIQKVHSDDCSLMRELSSWMKNERQSRIYNIYSHFFLQGLNEGKFSKDINITIFMQYITIIETGIVNAISEGQSLSELKFMYPYLIKGLFT